MEYAIIAVLAAIIIIQHRFYRRATQHLNNMTVFMMMLLLDEETYVFQRKNMEEKIPNVEARDEIELGGIALINYQDLANRIGDQNTKDACLLLWKLKTSEQS